MEENLDDKVSVNMCRDCEFSNILCPYRILNNYQKINLVKSHISFCSLDCVSVMGLYREFLNIHNFRKEKK